jgi:hypothetical protein
MNLKFILCSQLHRTFPFNKTIKNSSAQGSLVCTNNYKNISRLVVGISTYNNCNVIFDNPYLTTFSLSINNKLLNDTPYITISVNQLGICVVDDMCGVFKNKIYKESLSQGPKGIIYPYINQSV